MSTTRHTIVCGNCENPIQYRDPSDEEGEAGCPDCDNWAAKEDVVAIVKAFATDEAQLYLNRKVEEVAKGSKMMSFEGPTTSKKSYRFKIKDLL